MFNIIVNPSGASGRTIKVLKEVEKILDEKKIQYRSNISYSEANFKDITKQITKEESDIILIGGDGTFNVFMNSVVDFSKIHVGFLPCGSGNDFAKSLNITKNVKNELEKIIDKKVRRELDIGEVEFTTQYDKENTAIDLFKTKRFNNACGIGFDAEICERAEASATGLKKALNFIGLGKLIYLAVSTKLVFTMEKSDINIILDGKERRSYEDVWFVACMNEPYEGGGFKFGPRAQANDNKYEVCVAYGLPPTSLFKIFPYAYKGNHVKFEGIDMHEATNIEIKTKVPMWVQYDGEFDCKSDHIKLSFIKDKLQMLN